MAQTPTATLEASCLSTTPTKPSFTLRVDWADTGWANYAAWTDESANVLSANWEIEACDLEKSAAIGEGVVVGQMMVVLENGDRRFSSLNTAGALYAYIQNGGHRGKRVYLEAGRYNGATPENLPQFWGFIQNVQEDDANRTVVLTCHCRLGQLLKVTGNLELHRDTTVAHWLAHLVGLLPAAEQMTVSADATLYPVPMVWLDDENGVRELSILAAAQGGKVYTDYQGQLAFENATHWFRGAHLVSQHTFTGAHFANLMARWQRRDRAPRVQVRYTPRVVAAVQEVWRSTELWVIPASSTRIETVKFRSPVYSLMLSAGSKLYPSTDFKALRHSGVDKTSSMTITATDVRSTRCTLTMVNADTRAVILTLNRIRGQPVLPREQVTLEYGSTDAEVIPWSNHYVNTRAHGNSMGGMIYDRLTTPKPPLTIIGVPALPWLTLGDRVTLSAGLGMTTLGAFIVGIKGHLGAEDDFTNDFTVVPAAMYPLDDWCILGTSKCGEATAHGHVFY